VSPIAKEITIFEDFLKDKDLKLTEQRKQILEEFLKIETHITTEGLYNRLKQDHPGVGIATVYRNLKLLCECGLADELQFDDGVARYEHAYGHQHHDHLICLQCGQYIEVCDPEIEELQHKLAERNEFQVLRHRMVLYGFCKRCAKP
jgi:Fur family transcriptional regulator, ferric uptake regulator